MQIPDRPAPLPTVPEKSLAAGFSNRPIGTHTGKTMMLPELRLLLAAVPGPVAFEDYQRAVVEDNALEKSTAANRSNTLMYLKQLYGLRPDIPVFVAMRELWTAKPADPPLLALLCACARDVLLRSTVATVLGTELGALVSAADLSTGIAETFPGRYSAATLRNLGQNIASSWTQAGLLVGAKDKRRSAPAVHVSAVVYALYLGHLEGFAGPALLGTRWTQPFGMGEAELRLTAESAARSGWLEYRSSGGMTEMTFLHLDAITGWVAA
jgi:hypothetical protein